ncbi:MAG TPA: hypothetical protein VFU45_00210 [Gemmatimonadales bacterium]|nr:hypothetical protein [Gemmatimonadales bacterium]
MSLLDGSDPLDVLRAVLRILLVGATLVSLIVWLALGEPRMLQLATATWAIYGVMRAFVNGFLAPVAELPAAIGDDLRHDAPGSGSQVGALTATEQFRAAEARYRAPALPSADVDAAIQQAEAGAGPPGGAAAAVGALEALRAAHRLNADDDVRVGLLLVRLHEEALHDPAAALREFRRLVFRHPDPPQVTRIRGALADISSRFLPAEPAENQAP